MKFEHIIIRNIINHINSSEDSIAFISHYIYVLIHSGLNIQFMTHAKPQARANIQHTFYNLTTVGPLAWQALASALPD